MIKKKNELQNRIKKNIKIDILGIASFNIEIKKLKICIKSSCRFIVV